MDGLFDFISVGWTAAPVTESERVSLRNRLGYTLRSAILGMRWVRIREVGQLVGNIWALGSLPGIAEGRVWEHFRVGKFFLGGRVWEP